jgi:hypothetical protein
MKKQTTIKSGRVNSDPKSASLKNQPVKLKSVGKNAANDAVKMASNRKSEIEKAPVKAPEKVKTSTRDMLKFAGKSALVGAGTVAAYYGVTKEDKSGTRGPNKGPKWQRNRVPRWKEQ